VEPSRDVEADGMVINPATLFADTITSYSAHGSGGQKFLSPAVGDPKTSACTQASRVIAIHHVDDGDHPNRRGSLILEFRNRVKGETETLHFTLGKTYRKKLLPFKKKRECERIGF